MRPILAVNTQDRVGIRVRQHDELKWELGSWTRTHKRCGCPTCVQSGWLLPFFPEQKWKWTRTVVWGLTASGPTATSSPQSGLRQPTLCPTTSLASLTASHSTALSKWWHRISAASLILYKPASQQLLVIWSNFCLILILRKEEKEINLKCYQGPLERNNLKGKSKYQIKSLR